MNTLKRLLLFVSLFFLYIIVKEFLLLYNYTRSLHPVAGYITLFAIGLFLIYFMLIPAMRIFFLPRYFSPTRDPNQIPQLIEKRIKNYKNNPYLLREGFDFEGIMPDKRGYHEITEFLQLEVERIRKRYVTQVFYGTSIAQNGFLDAIIILSAGINMVQDMFTLYHGRVSNRDLLKIAKMVYYSMAIGGSEGIEYAVDEMVSKVFSGSMKGLPFASKILGSIADGVINAALLCRISLITENYCTTIFIESERALYPSYKTVISTTKIITSDLIERIFKEVKTITKDKTSQIMWHAVNPMRYIISKMSDRLGKTDEKIPYERDALNETAALSKNPVTYGLKKVSFLFKKSSGRS